MAPPIAAGKLGLPPFTTEELVRELAAPQHGLTLVESVGGVRSPISSDGDTTDLADAIHPGLVLLVADAGLGTINSVRLSLDALARHRVVVFLNRFDPNDEVHVENAEWLRSRQSVATLTSLDRWRGESTAGPSHHPIGGRRSPFAQAYIVGKR